MSYVLGLPLAACPLVLTDNVAGQVAGGMWGALEGSKHREATTTRLRINTILNGITKRGPLLGNSLAVVGLAEHRMRCLTYLCKR